MSGIRWLLFDVGGVLETVDDDTWPGLFVARWAERLALTVDEFTARVTAADLPDVSMRVGVQTEFWRRYAAVVGADHQQAAAMRADFWDAYCGKANTALLDVAARLRGRVGLAILSNSGDGAREEEERRFGFSKTFDPICYSHELGVEKPDPAAFAAALRAMGAAPDEVLFIDDHEANIVAARVLGLRALLHTDNAATITAIDAALDHNGDGGAVRRRTDFLAGQAHIPEDFDRMGDTAMRDLFTAADPDADRNPDKFSR